MYFSAYCSVDKVIKTLAAYDKSLTIESFITKAASKAFAKIFKQKNITVAKVNGKSVMLIVGAEQ